MRGFDPCATCVLAARVPGCRRSDLAQISASRPDLRIPEHACLSRGSVREKTMLRRWLVSSVRRSASGSSKKSWPVNERPSILSPGPKIPISRAMASAVGLVSPVIITTRMPAVAHSAMAGPT